MHAAHARSIGVSFGMFFFSKLSYLDIRNFVRLPLAHQWLLLIIKKDMWGGFDKLLGPLAGTQWLRVMSGKNEFNGSYILHVFGVVVVVNCSSLL